MNERLERLREEALRANIPVMRPKTAKYLQSLIGSVRPENCLEIGTCVGLGVVTMLLAGAKKVTSIEIDEETYEKAKETVFSFGLQNRCELILGDCREIIPLMENNRYDFVVLDGPKSFYRDAYPYLKKMLTEKGVLFADDVLLHGWVQGDNKPAHKHRTNVYALREFIEAVKNDPTVDYSFFEEEDGVLLVTKRGQIPQ